jgi:hypothetical protein
VWGAVVLIAGGVLTYSYQRWNSVANVVREQLLGMMPSEASVIFYADAEELRHSSFIAQVYKWAPQLQADPEYTQFLRETGFDYERDLKQVAISVTTGKPESSLLAVADGNFDQQKIKAYILRHGRRENRSDREIFSMPESGSAGRFFFTFLEKDRITLSNEPSHFASFADTKSGIDRDDWQTRFRRLAGSPVFAVIRQDAAAGSALNQQKLGGLESPQLAALLDQLQWITLAGRPQGEHLRLILEGECSVERTARQLQDVLNGIVLLAQTGLNGSQIRKQLDPSLREAYLELLRTADVSYIDRGDSKSVRLVLEVTPKFLEASRTAQLPAVAPPSEPSQPKMLPIPRTRRQKKPNGAA